MQKKQKRKWINSFTVGLFLTFTSFLIYRLDLPLFHLLELKTYDVKVLARGERPVSGQVVIVAVDEKSLQERGRWPWPRTLMAELTDKLTEAGAAVIGFDILFPEKDAYVPFSTVKQSILKKDITQLNQENLIQWLEEASDSDKQFAKAIEQSGRVVLGYFVISTEGEARITGKSVDKQHLQMLDFSQYSIVQRFDNPENPVPLRSIYATGLSIPELSNVANSLGYATFVPEVDGVTRWVPLVMEYEGLLFPPLSLQILQQATQLPLGIQIAPYGVDRIRLEDISIPTSESGDFLVNYYGPAYTFTYLSATDVLSGKVGAKELEGKIVLVGATAAATHDLHNSPYGPLYPGVEVHANLMENVLQGDYLMRPNWLGLLDIGMILGTGLILGIAALFFKAVGMAVFLFFGIGGYLFSDYYLFTKMGLWVNSVYPMFTQIFVYSGITLYRFAFEEREKRFIKGAFGQYLAPEVVNRLVNNPSLLKLGGERKVLTAFFSDVAGFSTVSEKLSPEELVELLNVYLTEMTDIIMKYEGTVDKFEGDAIIAFFGAPVPYDDHAKRACLVALEMQQRLEELRKQWKKEGKHELFMRIGLNTGPMVVGNMGSKSRMDYTMMGDSVNLAARLEGVNKQYGTYTMISESTFEQAKDFTEVRELDVIRVVGKKEPVIIYELLGKKGVTDEIMTTILPHFNKGLESYKTKQWDNAISSFNKALEIDKNDGPSMTYVERCSLFKSTPPPEDWDGVFSMTSK